MNIANSVLRVNELLAVDAVIDRTHTKPSRPTELMCVSPRPDRTNRPACRFSDR